MVIVTLQREKCIGCNYCVEMAPAQFQMSKKDGKSVLIKSVNTKGFHTLKTKDYSVDELFKEIKKVSPFIEGITVSGGESTLNADFLTELFRKVKTYR